MSEPLPIQLLEPDPISIAEIDAVLEGAAANQAMRGTMPKLLLFSPQQLDALLADERAKERHRLINTPETKSFLDGVALEAEHQRQRWGADHDAGKTPFDWVFLIGHLATRAAVNFMAGNMDKALHHAVTTAAACFNWHLAMQGKTNMRPGIDGEKVA